MSVNQRGVRGLASRFVLFAAVLGFLFGDAAVLHAGANRRGVAEQDKDKRIDTYSQL